MKKFLLFILFIFITTLANAATYYAPTGGVASWSTADWATSSDQATGSSGPPTSSDTVVLDCYGGNVTCSSASCVAGATSATSGSCNYTGTLTIGTGDEITFSGALTLSSGMTTSGSGEIVFGGNYTLTPAGLTIPWTLGIGNHTYTLAGALNIGAISGSGASSSVFSGAYNITTTNLYLAASAQTYSLTIPTGQTLTVTGSMQIINAPGTSGDTLTLESSTSTAMLLNYTGTLANQVVVGATFSHVNAGGSTYEIYNYNGGTLTGTTNIANKNASNIGTSTSPGNGYAY